MGCGPSSVAVTTVSSQQPAPQQASPSANAPVSSSSSRLAIASRESHPDSRPSSPLLTEPEQQSSHHDRASPPSAPAALAVRTNRNGFRMHVMQDSTNRPAAAGVVPAKLAQQPVRAVPLTRELVESALLSLCFIARCDWQSVGALACVCKGWAQALFGEKQAEITWEAICQSIGAAERLYVPPCYAKSWKALFVDLLFSARGMWHAMEETEEAVSDSASKSYQIQVFARFRPGDSGDDNDKLFLPLRQRLKLRRKGDKIASEQFGLPVKTVRELLDSGVLQTGTDLPPEIFAALAEAANLDKAADGAFRDAFQPKEEQDAEDVEAEAAEAAAMAAQVAEEEAAAAAAAADDEAQAADTQDESDTSSEQTAEVSSRRPHVAVQRRHGNARLLTVKPAQAVMFIPGQGFRPFNFHNCFDQSSQQAQVYEQSARDAVASVLNGFNASLLCYGQTGSGKTHTIFGPDRLLRSMMDGDDSLLQHKDAGVVLRAIAELIAYGVSLRESEETDVVLSLSASYVEIYQETVTDLLSGATVLVRDGAVVGAKTMPLRTLEDGLEMLKEGDGRKSRAATNMNDRSSRAHTMVIVQVTQTRPELDAVVESQVRNKNKKKRSTAAWFVLLLRFLSEKGHSQDKLGTNAM
jgi:hypothetical protein